jgi:membrane complex biogenesis BtpA family protein
MSHPTFGDVFPGGCKVLIGMIHIWQGTVRDQITSALRDLDALQPYVNGVILENYGWGAQSSLNASPDAVLRLGEIVEAVIPKAKTVVGLNILPNDFEAALSLASRVGARFIQLDHVTGDFEQAESVNPATLRTWQAKFPDVLVLGGIHPKYYSLLDPQTLITVSARTVVDEKLADAIVVTGLATGQSVQSEDLKQVRAVISDFPIIIGSGCDVGNAREQLQWADGAIVGTTLKPGGVRPGVLIDPDRVRQLAEIFHTVTA